MARRPVKTDQIPELPEADVQRAAIDLLEMLGCTVLVTSRVRKRCWKCGMYFKGGDGASKGLPDLLVRKRSWPPFLWVGIEIKGDKTAVSVEQQALSDAGDIYVCRGMDGVEHLPQFIKAMDATLKN